jgi:hypothetical protein
VLTLALRFAPETMKSVHRQPKRTRKLQPASTVESAVLLRKMLLLQRGFSVRDIARKLNVSVPFASMLIAGQRRSQAKRAALCRLLSLRYSLLWPPDASARPQVGGAE